MKSRALSNTNAFDFAGMISSFRPSYKLVRMLPRQVQTPHFPHRFYGATTGAAQE
jgi:hypothetical protein